MAAHAFVCRVLIDTKEKEDCFRDIEILPSQSLKDFHTVIMEAFNFNKQEMASFYTVTDDWEKMDEYPLFDMMDTGASTMDAVLVGDVLSGLEDKLLLVYDYLKMWSFLIECINETEKVEDKDYPTMLLQVGTPPDVSSKNDFDDLMMSEEVQMDDDFDFDSEEEEYGSEDEFEQFDEDLY